MNMYVLFLIGPFIETVFGRMRYLDERSHLKASHKKV